MDDWIISTATHWKLRVAVRVVNTNAQCFKHHPAPRRLIKQFIGQTARGIDFLGFHLTPTGLMGAKTTIH